MLDNLQIEQIAKLTGSESAEAIETVQSLWSGYGEIARVRLTDSNGSRNVIVKHICPPDDRVHKYGWADDVSHQRKLHSYKNEIRWYQAVSQQCDARCRVPNFIAAQIVTENDRRDRLLIMEDLDASGFDLRLRSVTQTQVDACLKWLANFHATFLIDSENPTSVHPAEVHELWPIGTYWHLATRPSELAAMEDGPLKQAAEKIDAALNSARFKTVVHGDAKLANFCFSSSDDVAAVDFQYVGGGCGIKDVAYFISSCFHEDECERKEQELLSIYFSHLQAAMSDRQSKLIPFQQLKQEWGTLYPFAWADFYRFLAGWSPGHWKMHGYSWRITQEVLKRV